MPETETEIVRVLKLVEYTGPREWVESTVKKSLPKEHNFGESCVIRTAILGTYPEIFGKEEGNA
jgi:hypothetical protein